MIGRRSLVAGAVLACISMVNNSHAQAEFPSKPIRLIVPFASGSGTDNSARNFSQKVSEKTGWNIIIENKPGGNGFIGINDLLRSPADGYTLIYTGGTTHGVNSALFKKIPYDPISDFTSVTPGVFTPMVLLARPNLNIKTAGELIELIRKNPGKFSAATGSSFQVLAINLLRSQAKLDFTDVSYKGSAQSMTDLLGGHVDFTMVDMSAAIPQIRGGAFAPLAVTSATRISALPSTPTMAEAGLPDIQLSAWAGLFVRSGTPQAIVDQLRVAFSDYFKTPEYEEYLTERGSFYEDRSPEQMTDFVRSEIKRAKEVFERAGITPQ